MKKISILYFVFIYANLNSQIINTAPYILTVDELKMWTEKGPTASTDLISTVALANRFINTETQFNPALNNNMQIAYLPDGMNNFGNYYGEQSQFNLYNFSHWAYIDKLVWFGGTSSQTIQLPSSPWANAAHKNGVKIFGNVFFAPTAFGGSTATLQNFLEQDAEGNFVAIPKMIAIMQYYNFDGWFINQETATTPAVAELMHDFVMDLTSQAEAVGKEVMWYDAMRLNGAVGWQNRLNVNNSPFVQDDQDADGTFETRVSSSIFINFFWGSSSFPSMSRARASTIGRSTYEVFTGADIWPDRNQSNFEINGNTFMGYLHEDPTTPYTSLGLFAPNCIFNHPDYTNFNNDPADYSTFYSAENRMFAGEDNNPATVESTAWKGFSNWIPEASVIVDGFSTEFNTGHGLKKFSLGAVVSSESWHDMNAQDLLPTWQWAFSQNDILTAAWDFNDAFVGGSSIKISGNLPASTPIDLMLFKTKILVADEQGSSTSVGFHYKSADLENPHVKLLLVFSDQPSLRYEFEFTPFINSFFNGWAGGESSLPGFEGREIAAIGLRFNAPEAIANYTFNLGRLDAATTTLDVSAFNETENFVTVTYSGTDQIMFTINWPNAANINYAIFDLQGRKIKSDAIVMNQTINYQFHPDGMSAGTYIVQFSDKNNTVVTKKILVK